MPRTVPSRFSLASTRLAARPWVLATASLLAACTNEKVEYLTAGVPGSEGSESPTGGNDDSPGPGSAPGTDDATSAGPGPSTDPTGVPTSGDPTSDADTEEGDAVDLACGSISVAAADVISDFRDAEPIMYKQGVRGGTTWYSYAATDASDPVSAGNTFVVDPARSGPCNSGGSLHASSPGNTEWGVGFGVNLMPDISPNVKDVYDARADGYTGVGFWITCQNEVEFLFFKVPDGANDADVASPVCSYDGAPYCNQYGIKNNTVPSGDWTYVRLYFDEAIQDWDAGTFGQGIDDSALTAFQVQINTKYSRDGSTRQVNPFDCWIDDVHFLRDPAPTTPPPPASGYTTQGNQIIGPNGSPLILRGLARPSFEWDPAGFGITREDIQRMKAWAPSMNVVRYSLSQSFWLEAAYQDVYQATIDRAVQWALQEGLTVILDLHWTGPLNDSGQHPMADTNAVNFWREVAQRYANDRRVFFELYNEPALGESNPQQGDWNTWRNGNGQYAGMQQLYNAVREAGAQNLVLVGGLDWAYNLSGVGNFADGKTNLVYVTHPYGWKTNNPPIPQAYGNLAQTVPVMATEFGYADVGGASANNCYESEYTRLLNDFNSRNMSWTGWAYIVDEIRCGFPALLDTYGGDPTEPGAIVRAALGG